MRLRTVAAGAVLLALARPVPAQPSAQADHVALYSSDAAKSAAFYSALFGMRDVTPAPGAARWLEFANGFQLHILVRRTDPRTPRRDDHFAFAVTDLAPIIAKLDAQKHPWSDHLGNPGKLGTSRPDGVRQLFVHDPDGYWVEINDRLGVMRR